MSLQKVKDDWEITKTKLNDLAIEAMVLQPDEIPNDPASMVVVKTLTALAAGTIQAIDGILEELDKDAQKNS